MKRGRPKGRSSDNRSFGPLGDLIRKARLSRGLGLADVAKACHCSVQFVSNIEHGRAPLPWDKVGQLATCLKVSAADLQAANLAIRSDFKSFVSLGKGSRTAKPAVLKKNAAGSASAVAFAALATRDTQLTQVIARYQSATGEARKKFLNAALKLL
ncbi:MAG: helix-turn-helix domain-containing protein [Bdellovibrionota bacterium]